MFVLRSPVNYEYHCSLLTGVLREADSVTYGINYESVLNKLDDFSVANGQLLQSSTPGHLEVLCKTIISVLLYKVCLDFFCTTSTYF